MRAALDWIAATLSPAPSKGTLSALDDPFYQSSSSSSSDLRIQMTDTVPLHSPDAFELLQDDHDPERLAAIQREREDLLCEQVYTKLSREISRVTKSALYMNDVITSVEMDRNGDVVQKVYWMGENHLYATVFMSCRNTPGTDLYGRAYIPSVMGGMKMIGIPGQSVDMIIDALWNHMIKQGFKVYSADGNEELATLATATGQNGIVATAAAAAPAPSYSSSGSNNSNGAVERVAAAADARADDDDTKRANARRAAAAARKEAETDKNK